MDYEKKYNDALERAKRLRDSFYQTMNAKRVVEEIFPELAESEDEKIRKWLYNMVENLGYPADEAAERQINEALFKWSYDDEDGIEQYVHDAFIAGAEWQKEQMLKDAVEGRVFMSFAPGHDQMVMADVDLPTNTRVKVIIVKEDEK